MSPTDTTTTNATVDATRPASTLRRFAAGTVDWAVTFALALGLTMGLAAGTGTGHVGRLVLVWVGLVWLLWVALAFTGRGLGALVAGVRVVDRSTGQHLDGVQALRRATVQVLLTSLVVMLGWLVGAMAANGLTHEASSGWYSLGLVLVALSPASADALFSRFNSERQAPWDRAANSLVIATARAG